MAATDPASVPPPIQHVPTAKEKRYDRQLRLWGAAGQIALEETHVLLVNSGDGPGVAGVETLKNLVLPGIGSFSILDPAVVTEADLGVNFFLTDESLGRSRAEETVRLLKELNPDVQGYAVKEPVETILSSKDSLTPYTLILVNAPIDPTVLATLQRTAIDLSIPIFYFRCIGFYASFSICLPPAFPIVDTHPDPTSTTDLRLLRPWPALEAFTKEKTSEMKTMNAHELAHIPYICILLHYLAEWRQNHDGKVPDTYREKQEFRDKYVARDHPNEENFQEAYAAVLKSLNPPVPSSAVRETITAPESRSEHLGPRSPAFWFIANAVQQFYESHGELPLPGAVPDMKAQSADYLKLQNIYKAKARADCAEVVASVRKLEVAAKRPPELAIDEREIENFCKGAAHINLVRGRRFQIAESRKRFHFGDRAKALAFDLTNPESLIGTYIALLAWDSFVAADHGVGGRKNNDVRGMRVPGSTDESADSDEGELSALANEIIDSLVLEAGTEIDEEEVQALKLNVRNTCVELVRASGGELHNIASLTGGLIAQEAIKVITRQYVPVDNTCVFDGVTSRSYVLRI